MKKCAHLLFPLLACLLPPFAARAQQTPEPCQYVQIAKVPIRYTGPGLAPSMQAAINDKPATMLVDTGAFSSFLTREGARRHQLSLTPGSDMVEGISGSSGVLLAKIERLAIGPGTTVKASMPVIKELAHTPSWDGLVGAHFLFQTDLEINLPEKEMTFFQAENCSSAHLAYWDARAVVLPMGFWSGKRKTPYFTIEINGRQLKAIIDSGAGASGMTARAARSIGIKLNGAGVRALPDTGGIGRARVKQWLARVDSIKIGAETISDTDLAVFEAQSYMDVDVLLGEDFLRSHRVLFAMSQKKIYLSYIGGNAFRRYDIVEPWVFQEAEQGNPEAQFNLALRYLSGTGGATRNEDMGRAWLARAAKLGHIQANFDLGNDLLHQKRYADSAASLRIALDAWPDDQELALALHVARLGSGQQALAQQELAPFATAKGDWPRPVVDYYLGTIGVTELLAKAGLDKEDGARRVCLARQYAAIRLEALGDTAGAAALAASTCADADSGDSPDPTPRAGG